ncbi:T4 family baseplate hub assembly chaperone [Streptomyces sp. KR80]|uniref:T4 family baseplate hub assembly chaperone n=1 Tax=Streptomyces sp. KR80 TaxID=3457426 RepID=UPI003FD10D54
MAYTGPAELLATWEAGLAHPAPERALLLHRAARPDAGTDALLSVPAGEREADLLGLRRALFGDRMQVLVECGACGEGMEFDVDARELLAAQALDGPQAAGRPPRSDEPLRVVADGWAVEFRLPTVADLTAAARTAEARTADPAAGTGEDAVGTARAAARQVLLERCVISAVRDGRPVPADRLRELPDSVQRLLAEAAERADPAAAVTLNIACPECGEATPAELDIATHLWTELDAWARDLMLDVHLLATAYGWSEPEILALSPLRRRYYLELCADA